ncbi:hypothetical protein NKH89_34975 [Mesorhizobium sp. M0923]|uniref:hypothetical protein n=1 Tax=Mesorhizobium sp. M0923 TaxID=2957028 RepID=UPI00333B62AC
MTSIRRPLAPVHHSRQHTYQPAGATASGTLGIRLVDLNATWQAAFTGAGQPEYDHPAGASKTTFMLGRSGPDTTYGVPHRVADNAARLAPVYKFCFRFDEPCPVNKLSAVFDRGIRQSFNKVSMRSRCVIMGIQFNSDVIGSVVRQGSGHVSKLIDLVADPSSELPAEARPVLAVVADSLQRSRQGCCCWIVRSPSGQD